VSIFAVEAQIMLSVIKVPYPVALQAALFQPLTKANLRLGDN
jgi:hypothetical protein